MATATLYFTVAKILSHSPCQIRFYFLPLLWLISMHLLFGLVRSEHSACRLGLSVTERNQRPTAKQGTYRLAVPPTALPFRLNSWCL